MKQNWCAKISKLGYFEHFSQFFYKIIFRIKERWELLKYQKQVIPQTSNNFESSDWSEEREREFVFSLLEQKMIF